MTTRTICFLLMAGALTLVLASCVDTPTGGQAVPDYHALARFVDVTADGTGGAVSVDGTPVATLSYGSGSGYIDILAGGRNLGFATAVQHVVFRSNSQNTVLVHAIPGSNRFLNLDEGYSFKNNSAGNPALAQVMFVHVALGSAPAISFLDSGSTGSPLGAGVAYASASGYLNVAAGAHQVVVVSNGGYAAAISGAQVAPSAVTTNTTGAATIALTAADSASYTVTMRCDPHDSLFTAAHFHVGLPGTNGGVLHPIDVTGQVIGFPDATLSGAEETPPNASTATATGTFSFTRDGLSYSITVTPAGLDSPFVMGHFHHAAAGVAGPVVRTITATPVGDTTLSGVWTATDAEPLTPALISELLAGNIYVNFHSAAHPGGAIRAQLVPDSITVNVFSGTWNGLTEDLKDTIVSGYGYINFHNNQHPNSVVRGQLAVDSTLGAYGVASLPAGDYTGGRMYTVVATGSGESLSLHQFSDRQLGISKAAPPQGALTPVPKSMKGN